MADQIFNVNCGFFNAVDGDRVYYAEDMNKPYKRIVANGVFATPAGTPSTDLQVTSANDGMEIVVAAGEGMFGNKWFENPSDISIIVSSNPNANPRVDSIIVQVDNTSDARTGNIVYRTGTPAVAPAAPALVNNGTVYEYRIANIYVASNANAINNDAITDLRGSSSCPWVTSLIQQVDTSTLFTQWQTAYQNLFNEATENMNDYMQSTQENWEAFVETLTDDLAVETNVIMLENTYTTTATTSTIPIGIPSYNYLTDILEVYINGLRVVEGVNFTLNSSHNGIVLTNALSSGQTVYFYVMKSVIIGDAQTVLAAVQDLNNKIGKYTSDSGWINFSMESGTSAFDGDSTPQVRKVGDHVFIRGGVKDISSNNLTICTLPTTYRPSQTLIFPCVAINTSTNMIAWRGAIQVNTSGYIKILGVSSSIANYKVSIACDWQVDNLLTDLDGGSVTLSGSNDIDGGGAAD